jgi:hypothetical protein
MLFGPLLKMCRQGLLGAHAAVELSGGIVLVSVEESASDRTV